MKDAISALDKLNASGNQMEKMKAQIIDTLQNLSAVAVENSSSTDEVKAALEEETALIEEISGTSEGLSNQHRICTQL